MAREAASATSALGFPVKQPAGLQPAMSPRRLKGKTSSDMADEASEARWERYYSAVEDRPTRPLFNKLMAHLDQKVDRFREPGLAIDLGCGDGTETLALLDQGWQVFAIDSQPSAIARLLKKASQGQQQGLETRVASFEEARLPMADLVYAGLSLPFCSPKRFPIVWEGIVQALRPGGVFAGHLFGDRDEWVSQPDMTFLSMADAKALFETFEIEEFHEVDEQGKTATQGPKHWHLFEVIARRVSRG